MLAAVYNCSPFLFSKEFISLRRSEDTAPLLPPPHHTQRRRNFQQKKKNDVPNFFRLADYRKKKVSYRNTADLSQGTSTILCLQYFSTLPDLMWLLFSRARTFFCFLFFCFHFLPSFGHQGPHSFHFFFVRFFQFYWCLNLGKRTHSMLPIRRKEITHTHALKKKKKKRQRSLQNRKVPRTTT